MIKWKNVDKSVYRYVLEMFFSNTKEVRKLLHFSSKSESWKKLRIINYKIESMG